MSKKFNNSIASIKEAVNKDRLVIFVGAGVSKDSGVPLWHELLLGIKGRLDEETDETDALKIAQKLYNEKGEKEYNDIIKELLFKNSLGYNPLHEILFELNPQCIITTNYDNYFESVINDLGLPFSIVSKDEDLSYAKHKKLLIKYHGDFENHNIVLKENDYNDFSKNNTLKEVFVKSLFSNKTILFVGYSVSDPNLKLLIREIQYILKKHYQRAYILTPKIEVSHSEIMKFKKLGINVVVQNSDYQELTLSKNNMLSDNGLKLYSLLKYIKNFKLYEYRSSFENQSNETKIINELYDSIFRFHYFRVLPQKTMAGLYPIYKGSKQEPDYLVHGTVLKCFNKDLFTLVSNYEGKNDSSLSIESKEKLNYSLSRIFQSGINSLGKVDMPGSWGGYLIKEELDFSSKIEHDNNCDCIDCTLNSYNYASALKKIFRYSIDNKSNLFDDLVYSYGLYRIRDFYNYFLALKSIITKSNRLGKLEVSFIAKYNIKRLKWAIQNDYINSRLSLEDINEIDAEIDKINLDDELDKVRYFVDKDVHDFLKEVSSGAYIQRLCNEIDEIFIKVPKTIEIIKNGGSHSSDVFNNLYRTVFKLKSFLDSNFLLSNGFSPVEDTFKKSTNTFVLGYYLKKFAGIKRHIFGLPHIVAFDTFMFKLIVENSNKKELIQIFKKNKIDNIKISKQSQGKIFMYINNFLKSSYEIPSHIVNIPRENKFFVSSVSQNESFHDDLKEKFNSICIVIAYFDFTKEQLKKIYSNLNHYLFFMSFGERDFEHLNEIYKKKHELLEADELIRTLEILDSKKFLNSSYLLILKRLKEKNKKFIHKDINLENFDLGRYNIDFPILFKVLNKEKKIEFKKNLEEKLQSERNGQLFYISIYNKILSTEKIKKKYKEIINEKLKIGLNEAKVNTDYIQFSLKQFFSLVYMGLIDVKGIDKEEIKDDMFRFLLNPEKFDSRRFNVDWLKYYNWDCYCERFSKISYIKLALEKSLIMKFDAKLSKFYFEMEKWHQ